MARQSGLIKLNGTLGGITFTSHKMATLQEKKAESKLDRNC